jgi:hypothetical protein
MWRAEWRILGIITASVLVACWGCGGAADTSSRTEVEVKGTVTIKGKPAKGGEVVFDPTNINRKDAPWSATKIGSNGTYTLRAMVGQNSVRVRGPQVDKDPSLATSLVIVEVKPGENTIPIDLR